MNVGSFIDCLIDIDRDTEFTGDDVDRYSKLVDLGREYESMIMEVPTIDSAALSVYLQETPSEAAVPKPLHVRKRLTAEGTLLWATTAGTGGFTVVVPIGGYRYVRVYSDANQTADRTLRLRGVRS